MLIYTGNGMYFLLTLSICIALVHSQGTTGQQPNGGFTFPSQTMFLGQETGVNTGQTNPNALQSTNTFDSLSGFPSATSTTLTGQQSTAQNAGSTNAIVPVFNNAVPGQPQTVNSVFPGQPPQTLNTMFGGQTAVQTFPGQQNGQQTTFAGFPGVQPVFPGQSTQTFPGQQGMQTGFPGQPPVQGVFPGRIGQTAFPGQGGRPSVFQTNTFPGQPQPFGAFNQQTGTTVNGAGQMVTSQQGGQQQQQGIINGQGQTFITGQNGQPGQTGQPGQQLIPGQFGPQNGQFGPQNGQFGLQNGQFGPQNGQFGPQNGIFGQQNRPFGQQNIPFGPQNRPFGPQNRPFGPQNEQFGPNGLMSNGVNSFNPFSPRQGQCHTSGCAGGSQCVFAPTRAHMCPTWIPILPCECLQGCQAQNLFIPLGQTRQMDRCGNTCTCNSTDGTPTCTMMSCPSLQQQQQQQQGLQTPQQGQQQTQQLPGK